MVGLDRGLPDPQAHHLFLHFLARSLIQEMFLMSELWTSILFGLGMTVGNWTDMASSLKDFGVGEGPRQLLGTTT